MSVGKNKDRAGWWAYAGKNKFNKTLATKEEAEEWEAKQRLKPASHASLARLTVGDLLSKYRGEITPTKAGAHVETSRINQILSTEPGKTLCAVKLSELQPVDAWNYINKRKVQKSKRGGGLVTARTVSRERAVLQDCLQIAKTQWGYTSLENVFRGLKIKGAKHKRTRRLEEPNGYDGEHEESEHWRLIQACRKCRTAENRLYVPLAIDMAIETGLRSQELFELRWRAIDIERRTIKVEKSKTDHVQETPGRTIVIPWMTMVRLVGLLLDENGKRRKVHADERVFPMTAEALEQAFDRVKERAGIEGLQFRDLRREANTRFGEREPALTDTQRKAMLGHLGSSVDINDVHSAPALKAIRRKLDRQFCGVPFEEKYAKHLKAGKKIFDIAAEIWRGEIPMPWEEGPDGGWADD